MDEILANIFEGQELTPEFKEKVNAVIQSAIDEGIEKGTEEAINKLEEQADEYGEYLKSVNEEQIQESIKDLADKNDRYMDYVAEQFVKENQLTVVESTKVEMADNFLKGLMGIAEQQNVQIPEGKTDMINDLKDRLKDMETRFDEAVSEKNKLSDTINEMKANDIVQAVTADLSESQKEKFSAAASKITFIDESQYGDAVKGLYKAYYPSNIEGGEGTNGKMNEEQEEQDGKTTTVVESGDYFSTLVSQALKRK